MKIRPVAMRRTRSVAGWRGGWFGEVAVAWLDNQLKGSADGAKWFVGSDCRLCKEAVWSVEKKGMR
jgi:hypothetical protein